MQMQRPRATETHMASFGIVKDDGNSAGDLSARTSKRIVLVERPPSAEGGASSQGKKHVPEPAPQVLQTRRRSFSSDAACRTDSVGDALTSPLARKEPLPATAVPRCDRTSDRIFPAQSTGPVTSTATPVRGRSPYSWASGNGNITEWSSSAANIAAGAATGKETPGSGRRSFTPQPTSPEFDLRYAISSKRRIDTPGQRDFATVMIGADDGSGEPTFRSTIRSMAQCVLSGQKSGPDPETPKYRPSKRPGLSSSLLSADSKKIFSAAAAVPVAAAPVAATPRQEPLVASRSRTGRKFVSQPDLGQAGSSRKKHLVAAPGLALD
jgi:hypothetical protein